MATTPYPHIEIGPDGVAQVAGTTTKVIEIVLDHLAHHWHAEDIQRQYPYLGLAQIHAALAFYYDHQAALDEQIEARRRRVAELRAMHADSAVRDKLKALGHLP